MDGRTIVELIEQGGAVMYPLVLCSVVSVAVILERLWALLRAARSATSIARLMGDALRDGDISGAAGLCRGQQGALAEVFRVVLSQYGKPAELAERAVQRKLAEVTRALRKNVWLLGTIGSLAPFVGLLGTVLGIVRSFENMAATGSGGFAVVAAGISEALIATAAGLLVGVLSIFAFNAFNVRIATLVARFREAADDLSLQLAALPVREGGVPRVVQSR